VLSDVAWSPDGRLIATSGTEGSARVWDARTGAQRFALLGHEAWVNNVDWSPDSGHLATASDDGTSRCGNSSREAHASCSPSRPTTCGRA
jgi:WD40 repeat protein